MIIIDNSNNNESCPPVYVVGGGVACLEAVRGTKKRPANKYQKLNQNGIYNELKLNPKISQFGSSWDLWGCLGVSGKDQGGSQESLGFREGLGRVPGAPREQKL